MEDIHSWTRPLVPSIIATFELIQRLDLLMKDGEDCIGRTTGLELGGEWMGK